MPHELMFDDDDPILARVREIALSLPEAQFKVSHGRPAFFTKKVFAYYGGRAQGDNEGPRHSQSIILQADTAERQALRQSPGTYIPAYLGPSGWTGVDLDEASDWIEVRELIEESFRVTAPASLVARLDEPGSA